MTFGSSSRRARCAALMEKRRVSSENQRDRDGTSEGRPAPAQGCHCLFLKPGRGLQVAALASKTLDTISGGFEGRILNSLIKLHWRILDCKIQNKREEINKASFIACSLSIKARSYQSSPALLKCSTLTGE